MIRRAKTLIQNESFMRYFKNSSWMMAEYGLRIVSAVFVSIYIARYLGPEQFGVLSYALAIVAIFMAISRLGMESILVRDIAQHYEQQQAYMSTGFSLMLIAALISYVILALLVYFFENDTQTKIYIWIIAIGLIFQSFLVIDYNFQAQVKAKYSSLAKSVALFISSILKIYLVLIQANLQSFAIMHAADFFIIAVMLIITHFIQKEPSFFKGFSLRLIRPILKSAWPMVLSALAIVLYMRIDQIMIKNMLNLECLGLYSAASKIFEGLIIIPYVISISLLPVIIKLKRSSPELYAENLAKLFAFVFWMGIGVAIIIMFFGGWLVQVSFGKSFSDSASVLLIMIWALSFYGVNSILIRYFTVEGMEKKIVTRSIWGLLINIILNVVLIPVLGINGAAIATVVSVIFIVIVINFFDKDSRFVYKSMVYGVLFKFKDVK